MASCEYLKGKPGRPFWQMQIAKWKKSGITQSEFCRQNGLQRSAFGYWRQKLSRAPVQTSDDLVEISTKAVSRSGRLEIIIDHSISIIVENDFDPGLLSKVVGALREDL